MGSWRAKVGSLLRRRAVRLGLLAAALLLGGLGVVLVFSGGEASRHRKQAEAALDRQDLAAACEHLGHYVAARPGDAEGHYLLARTLRRDGRYDEAERHLAEAGRRGFDAETVRRETFLAWLQQRGMREVLGEDLLSQAQAQPTDRALLEALYRGDLAARNWDRAGLWLHLWLERQPDDWAPRLWQAELLEKFKKYDRARDDYLRVLKQRPDHPRALLGVGLIALDNRADYAEAEEYLGRYLAQDPDHAEANLGLARCRQGRGDLAEAAEGTRGVLARQPRHAGAALLLGTIEAEAGHDDEALRWLHLAEAEGADAQGTSYQLAQVLGRLGKVKEAEAAHRRFTELRDARWALESAVRAAEREPGKADLQHEVGRLYLAAGEEDLAVKWLTHALKQDPAHRPSHAALADYYSRQRDPESAARATFHRRQARPAP